MVATPGADRAATIRLLLSHFGGNVATMSAFDRTGYTPVLAAAINYRRDDTVKMLCEGATSGFFGLPTVEITDGQVRTAFMRGVADALVGATREPGSLPEVYLCVVRILVRMGCEFGNRLWRLPHWLEEAVDRVRNDIARERLEKEKLETFIVQLDRLSTSPARR